MSKEEDKFKHSKRLLKNENAINKQLKILKNYGYRINKQPHRFEKKHALGCSNSKCIMCSNPRKVWKEKTIQEKRFEQNIEE